MNGDDRAGLETKQRRRRASKACLNCQKRKTKCNYDKASSQCQRCREEGLECVISEVERRGGYSNVLAGKENRERELQQQLIKNGLMSPPSSDENVLRHELYNPNDAIDILQRAYNDDSHRYECESQQKFPEGMRTALPTQSSRYFEPQFKITSTSIAVQASPKRAMSESAIVSGGVLSAEEATRLASFFFSEIAPFYFAFIPEEYKDLTRLAAEPALLAAVCTIGARCLDEGAYRELHLRLWAYCKQTLSSMLWECSPVDVRSLILAVLTIAEWFPGALMLPGACAPGEAMKRHTRICWPLMGQAVRLAKYVGLLRNDIQTTIGLHFTDHLLACRLGLQPMLHQLEDDSEEEFPNDLVRRCKNHDRARLDIVKLLHIANRSLYRSRAETRKLLNSGEYKVILELHYQLIQKWKSDYRGIVEGTTWFDRTIMFEFSHYQLYVFAIAIVPWQDSSITSRLLGYASTQKFLDAAIEAATAIIEHESRPERPVELRYAPIQWISRLLHASVFLAKALLIETVFVTPEQRLQVVRLLSAAAGILAQLPPDDQRMFSRPLETICKRFGAPQEAAHVPPRTFSDPFFDGNSLDILLDQDLIGHMLSDETTPLDTFPFP